MGNVLKLIALLYAGENWKCFPFISIAFHLQISNLFSFRFIAVCHPINSPRFRTPLVSKVVSIIAWCISAFLMLPIMLYSTTILRPDGGLTCNIMWPSNESFNQSSSSANASAEEDDFINNAANGSTFTLYTFTLGFAIPLCLILIFYYLVLAKLRTVGPKTKSKEKKRSHRKVTKLVLTVIAVYVFCWTPYWVSTMMTIIAWTWIRTGISSNLISKLISFFRV